MFPTTRLDEAVHQRVRLGVLSFLAREGGSTFVELRSVLQQTDGALGRHLGALEDGGLVTTHKSFVNRRPRTDVALTARGRAAIADELAALAELNSAIEEFPLRLRPAGEAPEGRDLRHLLVDAVQIGYQLEHEGPVDRSLEMPPAFTDTPSLQALRMTFMTLGLVGGWVRRWRSATDRISMLVVELGTPAAPLAVLTSLDAAPADIRTYTLDGPRPGAMAWTAYQAYLTAVVASITSGSEERAVATARAVARDQRRHLRSAIEPRGVR